MTSHSFFSPSKAHMWMNCTAALTQPANQVDGGSSAYADDGTASHYWAALCLQNSKNADFYTGVEIEINGAIYTMDEARADFVQMYLEEVRRRAIGGSLFVEYHIDLPELGEDEGGTMDAGIVRGHSLTGVDLKYGTGEKVFASYDGVINSQLGLYLLGLLRDAQLMGRDIKTVTGVISQPRLGHLDEYTISVKDLEAFYQKAIEAVHETRTKPTFRPGEKTCRWCRVADCKARVAYLQEQTKLDFEDVSTPVLPAASADLAKLYAALPMVETWAKSVREEMHKRVNDGQQIIGRDGKPYKFVEGKQGARSWTDPAQAEALLLAQVGPDKAYQPQKVITAPQASKIIPKQMWKEAFEPMIRKAPGKPMLVIGSDIRAPYVGAAVTDDFEEQPE